MKKLRNDCVTKYSLFNFSSITELNYAPLGANCGTAYEISSTTYTRETHPLKIISVINLQ